MADSFKNSRLRPTCFYLHNATIKRKLKLIKSVPSFDRRKKLNSINALKQSAFKEGKFDFFLIFNGVNVTYFTGFPGATALLIPEQGESVLYVSGVNYEQAKAETDGLTVELLKRGENLMEKIASQTASKKPSKIAVDTVPIESWQALAKAFGSESKIEPAGSIIREIRKVKDPEKSTA